MMVDEELRAVVLPTTRLDHWPISLEWENVGITPRTPFRFEKFCLFQVDLHEKLKEWWEVFPPIRGTQMYQFQQKIKLLKDNIEKLNNESFGNIFQSKQVLECKTQLNKDQGMSMGFSEELKIQEKILLQEFIEQEQ